VVPRALALIVAWCLLDPSGLVWTHAAAQQVREAELLTTSGEPGRFGGQLTLTQRAEPRTLNPVIAVDSPSREIIRQTVGDLLHINRETQLVEPALARSWTVSPDGRRLVLTLRKGLRFSDGDAFDADDVVFSFQVYLDEKIGSFQRELLHVGGRPIGVRKIDEYTVQFELAEAKAGAERMFDTVAMLPKHLLEAAYAKGQLAETWGLSTDPARVAGLGPFRFKEYVTGQRVVLERNPHYWKRDSKARVLPYLDRLVFLPVANEDAQVLRFRAGEADAIARMNAENFDALAREQAGRGYVMRDLGAGLDYTFLFFNQNDPPATAGGDMPRRLRWFRDTTFRQAVSAAVDREAIARLVYRGRAVPLAGHVPPGNKRWINASLPAPVRSTARAETLLRKAGFRRTGDEPLVDPDGTVVEFSILVASSNTVLRQIATVIQDDLAALGMRVHVVPFEFRAMIDRILNTHDYEAAILALGGGDADPNAELNVWLSSGPQHLWRPAQPQPATAWEAEIDRLMRAQVGMLDPVARKRAYDRVQAIVAEEVPMVFLVSPNVLVGARAGLGNFRPVVLDHHLLWNVEELFWRTGPARSPQ
jgi:peptide/nickel transport system substrate-binding protein